MRRSTELDATRDAQAAISLENTNAYEAQSLATTANTLQYATRSIAAGSNKALRFVNSVCTRAGAVGTTGMALGVGLISLRLNNTFTETVPPTPASSYLVLHDSLFGYSQDPVGQYGAQEQLRRYMAGLAGAPQLFCGGWGGQSIYNLAVDGTARTATVTMIKKFCPTRLTLFLGANDYGFAPGNLWTAADFGTAYAALLVAINAEFPSITIDCITPCTFTTETDNALGDDLADYRNAIGTATSGKSYANLVLGPSAISGGSNLAGDGVHRNNTGGTEIYNGFKTMWGI